MVFRFNFPAPLTSLSNFIIIFFLCIMMLQKSSAQPAPRTDPSEGYPVWAHTHWRFTRHAVTVREWKELFFCEVN
ncbi:hypothetical protein HanPSC8_Chr02g0079481 [Helianthus annuus]|nr:hypothetical protein HanPSC8_Chr02g0079481 [Helianthus annuus]